LIVRATIAELVVAPRAAVASLVLEKEREGLHQAVVGFSRSMERPMTKLGILSLSAGFIAAATLITPAIAQEATREPGVLG
jgi:hypothetical protein